MTTTIKYFKYDHLPLKLQEVSKPIGELAMEQLRYIKDCILQGKTVTLADVMGV